MKMYVSLSLIVFLVLVFFPLVSLANNNIGQTNIEENYSESQPTMELITENADEIRVLRVSSGKVEDVDMTEYIIGAVASEMPASFHEEALKAQAVACYTYAKWILKNADNSGNELSDISDSSSSHQGYLNKNDMKDRWGDKFDTYYNKLKSIVTEVEGQYLTYQGEPIIAVFHGISSGTTNSAKDVWGDDIPYLTSVSAPGDKLSADLDSSADFTKDEFKAIAEAEGISLSETEGEWISHIKTSESGYVIEAYLGDKKLSGSEMRNLFSLKSPNFTVKFEGENIVFSVKGKGHGVGMSQYSADFMARQGSDYKEILTHFYKDTVLER